MYFYFEISRAPSLRLSGHSNESSHIFTCFENGLLIRSLELIKCNWMNSGMLTTNDIQYFLYATLFIAMLRLVNFRLFSRLARAVVRFIFVSVVGVIRLPVTSYVTSAERAAIHHSLCKARACGASEWTGAMRAFLARHSLAGPKSVNIWYSLNSISFIWAGAEQTSTWRLSHFIAGPYIADTLKHVDLIDMNFEWLAFLLIEALSIERRRHIFARRVHGSISASLECEYRQKLFAESNNISPTTNYPFEWDHFSAEHNPWPLFHSIPARSNRIGCAMCTASMHPLVTWQIIRKL